MRLRDNEGDKFYYCLLIHLMQNETPPKYFLSRAWLYSKEMFPVLIYLPYVVALYACVSFIVQILSGESPQIDSAAICGMVSAFFIMLLMRTFDDLKDYELDKTLFPHRVCARGLVKRSDIAAISLFSFLVLLNVNVFFAKPTLEVFAVVISYCLLTWRWFFAEQFHRKHIFFTMLDHQPIPYAINFFLIHTAMSSGSTYESFGMEHFSVFLIVSLPVTAWEISRKIRSADMETEYETFSMVIGRKTATVIPIVALIVTGACCWYVGNQLEFNQVFVATNLIIVLLTVFFYLRFLFKPTKENNILTNVALASTSLMFFNLLAHTLYNYPVKF